MRNYKKILWKSEIIVQTRKKLESRDGEEDHDKVAKEFHNGGGGGPI